MKYKYTSFYTPEKTLKWVKRPMVEIEVFGPNESKSFDALVDSGADTSLFNILGIDLEKAKPKRFEGIAGGADVFLIQGVRIKLSYMNDIISIPVGFINSNSVGLLLGEEGFFDRYRIKFEKDHDSFEIKTKT